MSEKPVVVLCYASKEIKDSLSENWAHSTETLQDSQQSARLGDVANRLALHGWTLTFDLVKYPTSNSSSQASGRGFLYKRAFVSLFLFICIEREIYIYEEQWDGLMHVYTVWSNRSD